MLQKGAPIMPFSVAVMISVGMCGRGGRCGAEDMVEGLDDGGGGGEADVRWWDEELCSVVVVVIVVSVVSTGFDGKASLPESTCWLLLRLFSKLPVNLSRRLNSQFILYDGSESRCSFVVI